MLETGEPRIVVGQSDATLRITSFTAPVVGELVRAELASPGEARRVLGEVTVVLWCSSDLAMVLAHLVDDPAA